MENNAITLVYFNESRRRKNDKGITISLGMLDSAPNFRRVHLHESSDPKLPVDQEVRVSSTGRKSSDHSGHEVSDDDKVADRHTEALDGDGGIEYDGEVGVCDLR